MGDQRQTQTVIFIRGADKAVRGHAEGLSNVAFSAGGDGMVSGRADNTLRLWLAGMGAAVAKPSLAHRNRITSVAFSPESSCIVSWAGEAAASLQRLP